jgi:hypothetical protein
MQVKPGSEILPLLDERQALKYVQNVLRTKGWALRYCNKGKNWNLRGFLGLVKARSYTLPMLAQKLKLEGF